VRELAELAHVYEPIDLRSIAELVPASPTPTLPYPKQTYSIDILLIPYGFFWFVPSGTNQSRTRPVDTCQVSSVATSQHRHGSPAPCENFAFGGSKGQRTPKNLG